MKPNYVKMKNAFFNSICKFGHILVLLSFSHLCNSQKAINGPDRFLPGMVYHPIITAKWDPSSFIQVYSTGGKLKNKDACTQTERPFRALFVICDEGSSGLVNLKFSLGDTRYSATVTKELNGGQVTIMEKLQLYTKGNKSYSFYCTAAIGGSRQSSYLYQWQQSTDGFWWTQRKSAINKDLQFKGDILLNTFFRGVLAETKTGLDAYSDLVQQIINSRKNQGDTLFYFSLKCQV